MKKILAVGAALLLALLLAGVVYQLVATSSDARRFLPPGRTVTIDGVRRHAQILGEGAPTVVFDAPDLFQPEGAFIEASRGGTVAHPEGDVVDGGHGVR